MINHLFKLSMDLRKSGFYKEASDVDTILKEAFEWSDVGSWFKKQYNKLKEKFNRKRETQGTPEGPEAAEEYKETAKDALEEVLQEKESGPPEQRLYYWYTHAFESGCQVCASRHGRLRTLAQWRSLGFPGRNNTSCLLSPRCNCFLIRVQPGGTPGAAMNDDGKFNVADLIGLQSDNSARNMQQGAMFTAEQYFNNNMDQS